MTYSEKLRDPRWQRIRLKILEVVGWKCEDCGRRDRELQIHHCAYIRGNEPWEHTIQLCMALCPECHARRQQFEDAFRIELGKITRHLKPEQLESEVWRIIGDVSERETGRLAEAFS